MLISSVYGVRFNFGMNAMMNTIPGYLTGCTTSFNVPGGIPAVTTWDYATYLPWMLDMLQDKVWALGDYRDGLVGQDPATLATWSGDQADAVTNFQLIVVAEYLMMYYDHVKVDARIPVWIKTIADYMITQSRTSGPNDRYPDLLSTYTTCPGGHCHDGVHRDHDDGEPTIT